MNKALKILLIVVVILLVVIGVVYMINKNKPNSPQIKTAIETAPANEIGGFQKWVNQNKGLNLRTDGVLDDPTRQAATKYLQEYS